MAFCEMIFRAKTTEIKPMMQAKRSDSMVSECIEYRRAVPRDERIGMK